MHHYRNDTSKGITAVDSSDNPNQIWKLWSMGGNNSDFFAIQNSSHQYAYIDLNRDANDGLAVDPWKGQYTQVWKLDFYT